MSNISARLIPDPIEGIKLNAFIFATSLMAYLLEDSTAPQALEMVNNYILSNNGTVLTAAEIADAAAMKAHYDGLGEVAKAEYRDKLVCYAQVLQDTEGAVPFTEAAWDSTMGL